MTEPKRPANKTKRPAGNTQRPKRKRPAEHAAPAGAKTRRTAPKHTAPAVPRKPRKQRPAWQRGLQRAGSILLTTTLSFLLILVITCTIVGTTLVVYVLGFMEGTSEVSIKEMEMSYSTFIYAEDKDGEIVTLHQVPSSIKRIPIEASEIPQHVRPLPMQRMSASTSMRAWTTSVPLRQWQTWCCISGRQTRAVPPLPSSW